MVLARTVFYEAVSTTVKLDPQTHDDEWFGGDTWLSMTVPTQMELRVPLIREEASAKVLVHASALPSDRYLFVAYFLDIKGIRVGFYRTPDEKVLEWGDREQPRWLRTPSVEGLSRYELLMEDE